MTSTVVVVSEKVDVVFLFDDCRTIIMSWLSRSEMTHYYSIHMCMYMYMCIMWVPGI